GGADLQDVPTVHLAPTDLGNKLIDILTAKEIFASKSEGRRLIQQGGLSLGDNTVTDVDALFTSAVLDGDHSVLLRKGKKTYYRLVLK
ncbi:MAG: tyrosine--tRNA ligase, partial [Acidaminococcaceae bacterium]